MDATRISLFVGNNALKELKMMSLSVFGYKHIIAKIEPSPEKSSSPKLAHV
jgi:hypothetical protein